MTRPNLDRFVEGWRGPLLAALVALFAGLPGLLLLPPLDRDEARFAQITAQMLESGDYIDLRYQDEGYYRKPAGAHWLQAMAVAAVSEVEVRDIRPYRLPSLLGAMLAAWACAWGGAALFGARAGFLAGAMLGTTFLLSTVAGIATTDALLAGAITLAMAALGRIYVAARGGAAATRPIKLAFWIGLGLSILIKGPVGPAIVALTLLSLGLWDRQWAWMRTIGWGWGLSILALIAAPWAFAITVTTDGAFWREAVTADILPKLWPGRGDNWGLPGQYLLLAPLLFFPAALLLPAALSAGWSRRTEPAIRFAVCWLVPAWLMFEIVPTKLWHYVLPLLGAACWLAAAAVTRPMGKWSLRLGVVLSLVGGALVAVVTLYGLGEYGTASAQTWASVAIGLALAGAAVSAFLLAHRVAVTALLTALAFGLIAHAGLAGVIRQLQPLWVTPRLDRALMESELHPRAGKVAGPVAVAGYYEPSVVFLTGTPTELTDAAGAARAIRQGRPAVVDQRLEEQFRAALARDGGDARPAGAVDGRNYANGDRVRLTLYRPQDAGAR